jgi:type IV pilus assembly protein PilW
MQRDEDNEWSRRHGFSLVELLVAMAITAVVMAAVFKIYTTQQDSYILQEQVAEMQQNLRTAKYIMTREIRMAGYDPTAAGAAFGFVSVYGDSINFTMDITVENGASSEPGENITYSVADGKLERDEGTGNQVLVENVEAVGFAYAFDADGDGNIDTSANGHIIWAIDSDDTDADKRLDVTLDGNDDGTIDASDDTSGDGLIDDNDAGTALASPVDLEKIRAVKIWLLVKTGKPDRNYTNADTYVVGNSIILKDDQNRRQLLTTMVKCRNMAL